MTRKLNILLIVLYPFFLFSNGTSDPLSDLFNRCQKAATDRDKVESLIELASYYRNEEFNQAKADSFYQLAIDEADFSLDDELMFFANKKFLEDIPLEYENQACKTSCIRLVEIAKDYPKENRLFEAYYVYGKACLITVGCDDGKDMAFKAYELAISNELIDQIIKSKLLLGQVFAKEMKLADAFSHYSYASLKMEELGHDSQSKAEFLFQYDAEMFKLYMSINNYDKAFEHKQKQIEYVLTNSPVDSLKLMWLKLDMADLWVRDKKNTNISGLYDEILEYASSKAHKTLKNYCLSRYRTWLIKDERFKELKVLMMDRYPEELEKEWNFKIMAHIHEGMENMDSSIYYFKKEEAITQSSGNNYMIAHSFMRFGEFYKRQNDIINAKEKFNMAMEYAKNDALGGDLVIDVVSYLEDIAIQESDFEAAYNYSQVHHELFLENYSIKKQNDLTELTVLSDEERKKRIAEIEQQAKEKKHQAQYFWIVIIIVFVGVILIAISNMPVPGWLIEMMAFFSILSIFEFFILIMDNPIHSITHGQPIWNFLIKIMIFSFLFPLHHIIETTVTEYLKKNKVIVKPGSFAFKKTLAKIWPWLSDKKQPVEQS